MLRHNLLAKKGAPMPSITVRTFTDPDDFAASFLATNVEMTILGRGRFEAKVVRCDLGRLQMRRLSDNLPRIAHVADATEQAIISFRTEPGPRLTRDGVELLPPNIIWRSNAESYLHKSDGFASWASLSLPQEDMASVGAVMAGCDLTPPKDALTITPPTAALVKFQRLHAAAGSLAENAPAVIAHPAAAHSLEQALIDAMVGCLAMRAPGEDKSALRQHAAIMRRFRRVIEENPDQALFIPEVCTAIGASERTLRTCCQELMGVSPKRYFLLRRMHLVRRGLRESAPTATNVTEIATRYGFWQFGRFAGEYKLLFGELPSATLARPAEAADRRRLSSHVFEFLGADCC
jgi:AraC-like DNA-binding protein